MSKFMSIIPTNLGEIISYKKLPELLQEEKINPNSSLSIERIEYVVKTISTHTQKSGLRFRLRWIHLSLADISEINYTNSQETCPETEETSINLIPKSDQKYYKNRKLPINIPH